MRLRHPTPLAGAALLLAAAAMATGCEGKQPAHDSPAEARGWKERGMASWYGEPYHGRRTASGDVFDMHELTAAHRTLPFGTVVRVTNLENGKSVVVRINDRGPFKQGRIIDVSYAAANRLDMVRAGIVRVELLPERHR